MNLGNVHLTPGWATFSFVVPEGQARNLKVGDLDTQVDVKCRWTDGSIKHAILTCNVANDADYVVAAVPEVEPPKPYYPQSTPAFYVFFHHYEMQETFYTALPYEETIDMWLLGHLCNETRYAAVLRSINEPYAEHPFLHCVLDVRVYNDGGNGVYKFDVTMENVLNSPFATLANYAIWLGDITDPKNPQIYYYNERVSHPYLCRWRKVFNAPNLTLSEVTPDFETAHQAKAIPRFLPEIANIVYEAVGPDYDILGKGALDPYMPNHGGREELAPLPNWTARYIVHKDPTQKQFVLAHGDLAGSWPIHVKETDGTWVNIDSRPQFWLDPRGEEKPLGNLGATGPLIPDIAHQPSLAYVPYLISGDRYHCDEMFAWANYCLLATYQDPYYNARGGSIGWLTPNEVRGVGWAMRNLSDCAAYLPDNHPFKAYCAEKVRNNLERLDSWGWDAHSNPLKVMFTNNRPENWDPSYYERSWIALWEQTFVAYGIGRAIAHGFATDNECMRRIIEFQLLLFSHESIRDGGAPYICPIGTQNPPGSGRITFYESVFDTYQGPSSFAGYYGPDARMTLVKAIHLGYPGAQEAYDYLWPFIGVYPFVSDLPDIMFRSGWAVNSPY